MIQTKVATTETTQRQGFNDKKRFASVGNNTLQDIGNHNMARAFGYLRVSYLDNDTRHVSIDTQRMLIENWFKNQKSQGKLQGIEWSKIGWHGHKSSGKITGDGFFIDEHVSAFKNDLSKRPAGERLCNTLNPGDMVIFSRLDRAFRSTRDFATQIERWNERGVVVQFMDPQVDLSTAWGKAMAAIAAIFAELESAIKAERAKETAARNRARGKADGTARIGTKHDPVTMDVLPDELERWEYHHVIRPLYLAGVSFESIANRTEEIRAAKENRPIWPRRPLKGSENRRWNKQTIHRLVQNDAPIPKPGDALHESLVGTEADIRVQMKPFEPLIFKGYEHMVAK